jgi:hypothetical protein
MYDLTTYESYFKTEIVDKYPKIKGFYHIDLFDFDSFLNDLRGAKFKTPLLVLETYNTNTLANGLYNINDIQHGSFVLLGNFDIKLLNPTTKITFLTEIEEIVKQIRAKMLQDKRKGPCNIMHGLIPDSISISRTETIAGNFQGFRMEFLIESENEIQLSNDWL